MNEVRVFAMCLSTIPRRDENDKRQQRRGLPRDDIPHPSATASLNASYPGR